MPTVPNPKRVIVHEVTPVRPDTPGRSVIVEAQREAERKAGLELLTERLRNG